LALFLDILVAFSLVAIAWRIMRAPGHFQAVVLFITFGLLLSLAWARLNSPDIALAEAAVGAGLAGVLLLDTLRAVAQPGKVKTGAHFSWLLLPCLLLAGLLTLSIIHIQPDSQGLARAVEAGMQTTSLEYPVTAVLLDFRGYDTWLELGVLLAAVLGLLCVRRKKSIRAPLLPAPAEPVGRWLISILLPLILLVGGFLLWLGAFAPGGAFQAGVVWAAGGVLLWQAGHPSLGALPVSLWRTGAVLGFALFWLLAATALIRNEPMLTHPQAKAWILAVEYAAALSIAVCLTSLAIGGQKSEDRNQKSEVRDQRSGDRCQITNNR